MFADPQITVHQVLQTFHHDAPYLFLGASFISAGMIAGLFAALRGKRDALLTYFALFAVLYGVRLWVQADLFQLTVRDSLFFTRLRDAINYVVPVPAVLFLNATGLLGRIGKIAGYPLAVIGTLLSVATFAIGQRTLFQDINNVVVIAALALLGVQFTFRKTPDPDFTVIRRGLAIFTAAALVDNVGGLFSHFWKIEPYGFVGLLAALGYVAARRTLQRDHQLGEIQKELEVARHIQQSILPGKFPDSQNFRVAARYVPMTSVAGDFYDFIVANDQQAGIMIADVSGHGVPAALIASMVKLAATSQRSHADNPCGLLSGMNAALCGNTQSQFVTAAYVHLDSIQGELRYSAAGHPPMLLLRNGSVTEIAENGLMLAAFDFATYSNLTYQLERGDRLLLYTDGIVEAANNKGDFFGAEALSALLSQTVGISPAEAADKIIASVQRWSATQDDDLTVLVCDYIPRA